MKQRLLIALVAIFICLPAANAAAPKNGKALHDSKCTGCHGTRMYTRPNRKIHNLDELQARVEFCNKASKAGFSKTEKADVLQFLNTDFYKFPDIQ